MSQREKKLTLPPNGIKKGRGDYLPLATGHTLHMCKGLRPVNCPMDASNRKRGTPQNVKHSRKGIKNAPEIDIERMQTHSRAVYHQYCKPCKWR